MKNKKKLIIISSIAVGILLAFMVFKQMKSADILDRNADMPKETAGQSEKHDEKEKKIVQLSDVEIKEFGIKLATGGPGKIKVQLSLPGEVAANADRLVHVVPRVSGIVRDVRKNIGDNVRAGEVLAVLESRELADAKASFLAAMEREKLARSSFVREETLWKKKISAEQDYLEAKRTLADAVIELRSSEQKLHFLGFTDSYLSKLPDQSEIDYTKYVLTAPASGTIIQKHIARGEVLKDDTEAFVIADLNSVWVNINVYQKDMVFIKKGQQVIISAGHDIPDAHGVITYVGPLVGEQTRTGIARAVLPNTKGQWRPGLFVTAGLTTREDVVAIAVPKTALQTMEGQNYLFIKTDKGFEPIAVTIGKSDDRQVELLSGLTKGQQYVEEGAFSLKAQLSKSEFGDGHGH